MGRLTGGRGCRACEAGRGGDGYWLCVRLTGVGGWLGGDDSHVGGGEGVPGWKTRSRGWYLVGS